MFKRLPLLFIASVLSVLLVSACSDDISSSANDEPPTLPPQAAMEIEFSSLLGADQSQKAAIQAIPYYIQAVYGAGSWEGLIEGNLAKPRALLAAARDTVAVLNDNQQWEWTYQTQLDSTEYQNRLVGERITASTVNWTLFVTVEEDDINSEQYLSGTTTSNGESGSWAISSLNNADDSEPLAELRWMFEEQESSQIKLDILAGNGSSGSYIEYITETTSKIVTYFNADTQDTTTTQWNVDTRAGYIITPDVNEGQKACWDESQDNVSCSE